MALLRLDYVTSVTIPGNTNMVTVSCDSVCLVVKDDFYEVHGAGGGFKV